MKLFNVCSTLPWFFQHMFIPKGKTWELSSEIKRHVNIPVIFVGRVNSKKDVDKLKNEYNADYIGVGRTLVADPDFTGKYSGNIKGGIIIPETAREKKNIAKVVGIRNIENDEISVGDTILYKEYSENEIEFEGKKFLLIQYENILAKIVETDEI